MRTGTRVGILLGLALLLVSRTAFSETSFTVGSKSFEESRLLAEIAAQLVEERLEIPVERRLGLAGTQVAFEALRTGAIDLYPEYTGTGLVSILDEEPVIGRAAALNRVREVFLDRWNLWWLVPLGFENAYELAVPERVAREHDLRTISELARVAPRLDGVFGYEFAERPDGLPGLADVYGLELASVRSMQQALKYRAAASGDAEVLDVYTTEGKLLTYDLRVLEDDREFFPPYEAVFLVRGEALDAIPGLAATLGLLANAFDENSMRTLNHALEEGKEPLERVASRALRERGLLSPAATGAGTTSSGGDGLLGLLLRDRVRLLKWTLEHIGLTLGALSAGILVALPLGLALERRRFLGEPTLRALGATQTIPSLALLAFMIPLLGIGVVPALVALWLYSLYPIVRNTYTGLLSADPGAVEAATALGMTPHQVLVQVRVPLAAPVIMAGIRTAAVLTVGTATLAAFIGAGGLGEPIITGLQMNDPARMLSGAIPAALLALIVDRLLAWVEKVVSPMGMEDVEV